MFTPDERRQREETTERIRQAIAQEAKNLQLPEGREFILGDFIVIASWIDLEADDPQRMYCSTQISPQAQAPHVDEGLLSQALFGDHEPADD